ncbi:hypothetical protein [Dictyobacter vulcani]|nr:hypothetical protein [Dictyobacter vulcani]
MDEKINLAEKLTLFADYWSPRTVAQLNSNNTMCNSLLNLTRL